MIWKAMTRSSPRSDCLSGEPYRQFKAIIGWKALQESVEHFGKNEERFTSLTPELNDQGISSLLLRSYILRYLQILRL